jgi:hypothetical protein
MNVPVHSLNACNSIENAKSTMFIPHMIEWQQMPKTLHRQPASTLSNLITMNFSMICFMKKAQTMVGEEPAGWRSRASPHFRCD